MSAVYFLGAGATKADHAAVPLGDELLHVALRDGLVGPPLTEFLQANFEPSQLEPSALENRRPRLDDVFTLIDAATGGRAPFPPGVSPETAPDVRRSLVCAIGTALDRALPGIQSPSAERLARFLKERDGVVISTNYDITMDNAFYIADPPHMNYGVVVRSSVVRGALRLLPHRWRPAGVPMDGRFGIT